VSCGGAALRTASRFVGRILPAFGDGFAPGLRVAKPMQKDRMEVAVPGCTEFSFSIG
jgi:hypothetical protein